MLISVLEGLDVLMKKCFKCKRDLHISQFYKHPEMADGRLGKCKECTKKDAVVHRVMNLERIQEYDRRRYHEPERRRQIRKNAKHKPFIKSQKTVAHQLVYTALKSGKLVRRPCEVCGNPRSDSHHNDYSKPLEVKWLCRTHHAVKHRKYDYGLISKSAL